MKNKKGRGEIEKGVSFIFGIVIIIILISSGFIQQIFQAFSGFNAFGGILAIIFVLMVFVAIWEAFKRR